MSGKQQSSDHDSTQLSVSALLLALLAIALILLPAPQSDVSFAAEDDNASGGANNEFADSPPPALSFTAEDDLSSEATTEVADSPPPATSPAAEDNLSSEVADSPPPATNSAAENDLDSEATTQIADSPPPATNSAAENDLDSEATTEVADSSPPGNSDVEFEADTNKQKVKLPVYDTAWEIFYGLPLADVDEYFAYLSDKGYAGLWASVLPLGYQTGGESANSALYATNNVGGAVAYQDGSDVLLTTGHINHVKAYLDKAQQYGLELNLVIAWANNNVSPGSGDCAEHSWGPARYPTISESNAYAYGQSVAQAFGTHPAIGYWVLGGDDIWSCDSAQLWINMRNGLRTADLDQPTTYHTGGDYNKYRDESWNDFLAAQTGWGQSTDQLGNLKASTGKVTYAAEMRYYLDTGFTAEQVGAETQVALDQGVDAMLYGDMRRVHYGMHENLYKDMPVANHIRDTFNSPGEDAFFGVVGL